MSDDNMNDEEYWDDMYYYENYNKEMDPNNYPSTGHSKSGIGIGFVVWLVLFIIASNISSSFGSVVLFIGIALLILSKVFK